MTTPSERTRSIIQTEAFLTKLSQDPRVPDEHRQEARRLLRHYPNRDEILNAGALEERLCESGVCCAPSFSSTLD